MKFNYIVGNPPYQDESQGEQKTFQPPTYHTFMDAVYELGGGVELIHPARFLFNAGSTPKAWNQKMLHDPHFKVMQYERDASAFFPNVEIKGGIAITYRDDGKEYTPIEVFSPYHQVDSIRTKAAPKTDNEALTKIIFTQNRFDLSTLYTDHPYLRNQIGSNGNDKRFRNNIFEKVPLFVSESQGEDLPILGVIKNKRHWKYFPKKYMDLQHENLFMWKVLIPRASGSGELGEPLAMPFIVPPGKGYTQTFVSVKNRDTFRGSL